MDKNEFVLEDRVAKTQAINEQHDLEHNSYFSFSGGYDSCVGSVLLDVALPNNRIPRVYFNTGIEYSKMVKFVKKLAAKDDRFIIVNSGVNIKQMLKENGYPFKSKQHAHNWAIYNNNNKELNEIIKYLTDNPEKQFDYNYIHNLPKGIKTIVKYVFGIREKETHDSVVEREREREHYNKCYVYNDFP